MQIPIIFKIKYSAIIWAMFYFIIFSFLLYNSYNYLDNDLGWHLAVGEAVIEERAVPDLDNYNYTLAGKSWVDHEWLLDLTSAWLFDNFGYLGVNIFFSLIVVLTLAVLNIYIRICFFEKGGIGLMMAFQFFGVFAMAPHLGVRMQVISLLNFSFLLLIIGHYVRTKNFRVLFWLWPLFCFWANVHAGFLIGLFVLFFWIGIKATEIAIKKIKNFSINFVSLQSAKELFVFLFFSIGALVSTLLNPYGLKLYSFLSSYANDFYLKTIEEWMPAYALPIQYNQIVYAAIVVAMMIIFFSDLIRDIRKKETPTLDLWSLGLIWLFLFLALNSKRHFPLFFVVSFPWLMATIKRNVVLPASFSAYLEKNMILKIFVLPIFLLVAVNFLVNTGYVKNPFLSSRFCGDYPCGAVHYMKSASEQQDRKIFNNYGWGGYLIYVWPEKKLFIDGRLPIYEFAGHTLFEEYFEFFKEGRSAAKLDQYGIDMVLLRVYPDIKLNWFEKKFLGLNEREINDQKMYLHDYLENSPLWELGYSDRISRVYIRL